MLLLLLLFSLRRQVSQAVDVVFIFHSALVTMVTTHGLLWLTTNMTVPWADNHLNVLVLVLMPESTEEFDVDLGGDVAATDVVVCFCCFCCC